MGASNRIRKTSGINLVPHLSLISRGVASTRQLRVTVQVVVAEQVESDADGGSRTARLFGQRILSPQLRRDLHADDVREHYAVDFAVFAGHYYLPVFDCDASDAAHGAVDQGAVVGFDD